VTADSELEQGARVRGREKNIEVVCGVIQLDEVDLPLPSLHLETQVCGRPAFTATWT
jgi:hypothetical protein